MSEPWTFALDTEGPCNGDVLVKTGKGALVALFYSTGDDARTLARARAFCRAWGPQHCSTCGKDTPEGVGDTCKACQKWWAEAELLAAQAAIAHATGGAA